MPIVYKSCTPAEAAEHFCNTCDTGEKGRVRSLVLIALGTTIATPLTSEAWTALVEAGTVVIIPETSGTFDGGTPKMITGFGDVKEKKIGDDYVLTVKDPNYKENISFWENTEKETWNIAFRSETQLMIVNAPVTVTAKAPIEDDLETSITWNIEAKWFSSSKPKATPFAPIADLFSCFEITE